MYVYQTLVDKEILHIVCVYMYMYIWYTSIHVHHIFHSHGMKSVSQLANIHKVKALQRMLAGM